MLRKFAAISLTVLIGYAPIVGAAQAQLMPNAPNNKQVQAQEIARDQAIADANGAAQAAAEAAAAAPQLAAQKAAMAQSLAASGAAKEQNQMLQAAWKAQAASDAAKDRAIAAASGVPESQTATGRAQAAHKVAYVKSRSETREKGQTTNAKIKGHIMPQGQVVMSAKILKAAR